MKNFNLLQVVPSLNSGGVEQGTLDLAKGLVEKGYKSFAASSGGKLVLKLEKYNSKHFTLPLNSKNIFTIFLNIRRLKKIINQNNINIVHVRSRAPAWTVSYCKSKNVKTVSTYHNIYGHENFIKKKYNQGLARSDKIIAISKYVKDSIVKLYNINPDHITVIHRGIDTNFFDPNILSNEDTLDFMERNLIPLDKKIILFPARLTEWKGQLQFIDLLKKIENKNIYCLFVGDDKNVSYSKKLIQKINNNKLGHICKILGNQINMPLIYKIAHIVVSAPLKGEGFGRTISESMAMRKLVIAYDFGGVAEQIKNLPEISHVSSQNQEELLNKIHHAINLSNSEYNNITSVYKEIILKNFTKQQMINKTINLYKSIL